MANKKNIVTEFNPEIRDALIEEGAVDAYKCFQCGKCASVCPWFQVGTYEFLVFRFPMETVLGLIASSEEKEELAKEVISIPLIPELNNEQVQYVIHTIRDFYEA